MIVNGGPLVAAKNIKDIGGLISLGKFKKSG